MRKSLLFTLPALAIAWLAVQPTEAGSLADAVDAAMRLGQQQPPADALRNESQAIRAQVSSLVADDPSLRVMHLSDRFNADENWAEWEALVDMPLWLPGQKDARSSVADAADTQADAVATLLHRLSAWFKTLWVFCSR